MVFSLVFLAIGLVLLVKGAGWLLDSAVYIAEKTGLPKFVIGVTVVAIGTSIPELIISIIGAQQGNQEIILGNILGSNISNILWVTGIAAMIKPIKVRKLIARRDIPFAFASIIVVSILALDVFLNNSGINALTRSDGLILLTVFGIFLYYVAFSHSEFKEVESKYIQERIFLKLFYGVLGLAALVIGGSMVVENAVDISESLGVSQKIIGVTIVAMGTSLPELITMIVAIRQKQPALGLGNIIGSNIVNLLFIMGITSSVYSINDIQHIEMELFFVVIATTMLIASLFLGKRNKIDRSEGFFFLMVYLVYLFTLIRNGGTGF